MDYKELLKKYWFVLLVGIVLIVFVVAWAADNSKNTTQEKENTVQTKEVDGKYVLFEMDGNGYTADEFYDVIDMSASLDIAMQDLFAFFANKEIKSTEEIKTLATSNAQYYILNTTPDQLEQMMRASGLKKYGNITNFFEELFKKEKLKAQFLKNHTEDIINPYIDGNTYKKISHILIKVADVTETTDDNGNTIHTANPTEEESAKLQNVLDMLKTDTFAKTAAKYSDDGSAVSGGKLGCYTDEESSTTFVSEFADAVASLGMNQQSEVITTQYGYHIIYIEEATTDDIAEDERIIDTLIADNSENYYKMLIEYSDKYNVEFVNDDLIELLDQYRTTDNTDATESEASK